MHILLTEVIENISSCAREKARRAKTGLLRITKKQSGFSALLIKRTLT
ncbi:hypothetical protein HMPREF0201_03357 [Cedecea davisae DSM 4568]|uniref:Uncharacterized protein n=1 Tax=Cedecea davisae DSM 4568 TaxID=566551 RepID=S3J5V8_9ENTR|nr:hypothetical protein HMPREF0201_03357 [Cedecea davisae DSM 4568]